MTTSEPELTPLSDPDNLMFEIVKDTGLNDDQIDRLLNGQPLDAVTADASEAKYSGAMIALVPSDADIARLALAGYELPEELHLTLYFLGETDSIAPEVRNGLVDAIGILPTLDKIDANAFGVAHWNIAGDSPSWVLNVGDVAPGMNSLHDIREAVEAALDFVGLEFPEQHTPWSAHICIAYTGDNLYHEMVTRVGPITFDRIRVAFSRDVTDIPLD